MTGHISLDGCSRIEVTKREDDKCTPVVLRGWKEDLHFAIWLPPNSLPALKEAVRILEESEARTYQEVVA